ncbi:hypothetical protein P152DRAFT_479469 [Eremomyces bilateralis CBS 781.70]|uniref:C3H1-type domain-containing protein n=1 Tax=Eremomyces bilateralis CBS 781.70 TaxID=1392243 RepID=A0A6G1GCC4_9PEZI|nr:uncharacterized protein P152DRAFT_479469 [Eremomyces bilateralis CBS 781.70]KAF1815550.1 hypothetical protein P152DRAFT_479469 [Eremomyces bilateralis CBS 781.70]
MPGHIEPVAYDMVAFSSTRNGASSGDGTHLATRESPATTYSALQGVQSSGPPSLRLWQRYDVLKRNDAEKNTLIEELIYHYQSLQEKYEKQTDDHDREREANRTLQKREKDRELENRHLHSLMNRDPFALVLLDGDGMIFHERFMREGEDGGRKAANELHNQIAEYVSETLPNFSTGGEARIVCRLYANLSGLAETCRRAGLIATTQDLEEFMKGFTRAKTLFDFVDVGSGKDRADGKIIEHFKLNLYDYHCRQIILGCSHDNGYARTLEEIVQADLIKRITLLEGVPFERELVVLPFRKHKIMNLFRETKILSVPDFTPRAPVFTPGIRAAVMHPPGFITASPPGYRSSSALAMRPVENGYPFAAPRFSSQEFPSLAENKAPTSFAEAVKAPTPPPTLSFPIPLKATATVFTPKSNISRASSADGGKPFWPIDFPEDIPRNRKGQRIDVPVVPYDKDLVNKIKALKLCNIWFLRGDCPYYADCTHQHQYEPSRSEMDALRICARMAPCQWGSLCDEMKCIYGHVCPAPKAKSHADGSHGKTCIFGSECRFGPEMHDIDKNIVRFMTV